jgi:general secretion pathway protein C
VKYFADISSQLKRIDLRSLLFTISSPQVDKYRPMLILLAMTVIIYSFAGIFYKIVGLAFLGNITAGTSIAKKVAGGSPAAKKEPFDAYKVIMNRNLFGSTDKIVAEKQMAGKSNEPGDVTQILDLKGTVAGDGRYGFAIIEEKGRNKQVLYKVGGTVAGAKIVKIIRNAVVLNTGGREVILKMREGLKSPLLPPAGGGGQRTSVSPTSPSGSVVLNKGEMEPMLKDMGMMLSQAQIGPFFSAGKPDGFIVSNMKPDSIFKKMGLIDGDVLQSLNDRQIKTADDMVEFYNSLKSGSPLSVRIKRQGKQEELRVSFQ